MQAGSVLCLQHCEETHRIQYATSCLYVRIVQDINYTAWHRVNSAQGPNLYKDPRFYGKVRSVSKLKTMQFYIPISCRTTLQFLYLPYEHKHPKEGAMAF